MMGPVAGNVTLEACPAHAELAAQWRALEERAAPSFFTSWTWIGTWLEGLEAMHRPILVVARRDGRIVGLGLLVAYAARRVRVLPSVAWHLHATGQREFDDITIEHNGLLVQSEDCAAIEAAMLEHLCEPRHRWDQLHLPGLSHAPSLAEVERCRMIVRRTDELLRVVDLAAVRIAGGDYLAHISANSRAQVRRSVKAYSEFGEVRVEEARSIQQALCFLEALKEHHQRTWTSRGEPGAFANPRFESFHRRLIERGFARGEILLLRICAGEHDVGYLYNFVYRGRVMAYQSGFNYALVERRNHPGLSVHALAIQYCVARGDQTYDCLGGDVRYKRQLATHAEPMVSLSIHRPSLALSLEESWWAFKRRGLRSRAQPGQTVEGTSIDGACSQAPTTMRGRAAASTS